MVFIVVLVKGGLVFVAADPALNLKLLLEEIDRKREAMITTALATGFTSEETITCSQELDVLINLYQQQVIHEKKKGFHRTFLSFFALFAEKPLRITNKVRQQ
jgi:hypothetical protein